MEKSNISKEFAGIAPLERRQTDEKWSWAASVTFVVLLSLAGWTGFALLLL